MTILYFLPHTHILTMVMFYCHSVDLVPGAWRDSHWSLCLWLFTHGPRLGSGSGGDWRHRSRSLGVVPGPESHWASAGASLTLSVISPWVHILTRIQDKICTSEYCQKCTKNKTKYFRLRWYDADAVGVLWMLSECSSTWCSPSALEVSLSQNDEVWQLQSFRQTRLGQMNGRTKISISWATVIAKNMR